MKKVYIIVRKLIHPETGDIITFKLESPVYLNETTATEEAGKLRDHIMRVTTVRPLIYNVSFEILELDLQE